MPTLNELFGQAAQEHLSAWAQMDDAAKTAAIAALKTASQPFYQHIVNMGFGAAQAQHTETVTRLTNERIAAETRATTAETTLRVKQDKDPDVAQVNKDWEARLETQKTEQQTALDKSTARVRRILETRDQVVLQSELETRKVPRAVAKVLARDPAIWQERADYADDEVGTLSVRQAGTKIPLSPGSGQTVLGVLADEIAAGVDATILLSDVDTGSGITGREAGRNGSDADASYFEGLRKRVSESQVAEAKPLRERVGNR